MQSANLGRICVNRMALEESIKSTLFVYVLFYYYYNWNSRPRYHGVRGWKRSCVPINMNPFLPIPWNCSHKRGLRGFIIIIVTIIFLLSQRIRTVNELWGRANGFSWKTSPLELKDDIVDAPGQKSVLCNSIKKGVRVQKIKLLLIDSV